MRRTNRASLDHARDSRICYSDGLCAKTTA